MPLPFPQPPKCFLVQFFWPVWSEAWPEPEQGASSNVSDSPWLALIAQSESIQATAFGIVGAPVFPFVLTCCS